MILLIDELKDKALDWVLDCAIHGYGGNSANFFPFRREREGLIEVYVNDDCHPPGWYEFQSRIKTEEDMVAAKEVIKRRLGEGPFIVPTDLCVSKYAHKQHRKISDECWNWRTW